MSLKINIRKKKDFIFTATEKKMEILQILQVDNYNLCQSETKDCSPLSVPGLP